MNHMSYGVNSGNNGIKYHTQMIHVLYEKNHLNVSKYTSLMDPMRHGSVEKWHKMAIPLMATRNPVNSPVEVGS